MTETYEQAISGCLLIRTKWPPISPICACKVAVASRRSTTCRRLGAGFDSAAADLLRIAEMWEAGRAGWIRPSGGHNVVTELLQFMLTSLGLRRLKKPRSSRHASPLGSEGKILRISICSIDLGDSRLGG